MPATSLAKTGHSAFALVSSRRALVTLYSAVVFLYWICLYTYVPTLPTYAQSKSDNLALVGVALSMYGLWQAIIRLPLGIVADWLGQRKPFIIGGLLLAGLGAWVMGIAQNVEGILIGRAITGLAAGTWVPLVVVFNSLFPPEEAVRATAILNLVGSVGRVLATGSTGWLNSVGGYPLAFFLALAVAILAALLVLPAQEVRRPSKRPSVAAVGRLITRRDVLLPALLAAVNQYANWAATFGFVPILAKELGATDMTQSLLASLNIGVLTLGNLLVTTIVKRLGAQRLVYLSFILLSVGIGLAALAPNLALLFAAQLFIGLSQGIMAPVLMGMSIRYVVDAERTTAMGLHQSVYAVGMFAGPAVSGVLAKALGIRPMFGVTAFFCLALGMIATRWLSEKRPLATTA